MTTLAFQPPIPREREPNSRAMWARVPDVDADLIFNQAGFGNGFGGRAGGLWVPDGYVGHVTVANWEMTYGASHWEPHVKSTIEIRWEAP